MERCFRKGPACGCSGPGLRRTAVAGPSASLKINSLREQKDDVFANRGSEGVLGRFANRAHERKQLIIFGIATHETEWPRVRRAREGRFAKLVGSRRSAEGPWGWADAGESLNLYVADGMIG